ncbi:MAG: preprotein translocase subunit SecG [Ignavibacteriae bacterium]|nr:preprotein translocase subunit SecG [Ignavibacteriota bacterium]
MITLFIFFLIIISILLIAVVLMQSSKGNGLAGPIGGSSVTMAFGVRRTSDILTKATTVLATVLILGSIVFNLMIEGGTTGDESIIQKNAGQQQQQLPPTTVPPSEPNQPPSETNQPPSETDQQQNTQEKAPDEAPPQDK